MNSVKASYILEVFEMLFLIGSAADLTPSLPTQYLINQYLPDNFSPQDVEEGLVNKRLAKKTNGNITLEPVVDLLVRSALSSDTIWVVKCGGIDEPVFVLKADDIFLHIMRYPHISNAWKITPYKNKETLLGEFDVMAISEVRRVNKHGEQRFLDTDEKNRWIEGDAK